ncbi:MAG TPA: methylmalonyl-CoA epimerase [Acidobacteriota bacterium]|jgi:methylmalonyl-CoA epimerase
MIKKIGHLGFATRSIGVSMEFFKNALGLELDGMETVDDQKVKVAMLKVGDTHIELIEPTAEDSPVGRFLQKHGEGFHHITFEVDDLDAEMERLKELNVKLINGKPRAGAHGRRIVFIHPDSTGGILIELTEMEKK